MERFWKYRMDHVIFWSATIFFHMFTRFLLVDKVGAWQFLLEIVLRNSLLAAVIYTNNLVLIPKLIQRRKIIAYVASLALLLAAYAMIKNAHDVYLYGYVLGDPAHQYFFKNTFYNISIAVFYMAFGVALQLSRAWYSQRELIRKIEIEKLNTELEYLKSQINPHFLFNSINTIYFQIDKHNTQARDTLSTFSEMLRYQLYECNGHEVRIEKELSYLKNYVDLQRLRKDKNYEITFACSDDIRGFTIAPLLLICFVENAFKHVSHFPENNKIRIGLIKKGDVLNMNIFNTCDNSQNIKSETTGIGLKNVKRRLELLYGDRHKLEIKQDAQGFEINLDLAITQYDNT